MNFTSEVETHIKFEFIKFQVKITLLLELNRSLESHSSS